MNSHSKVCTWLNMKNFENDIQTKLEKVLIKYELSPVEFSFLHYLYNQYDSQASLLEIKESLNLSSAAVSRMAVRLESKDCKPIIRYHSDDNHKEVCLKLTTSGVKSYKEAAKVVDKSLNDLFATKEFQTLRDSILSAEIE